MVESLPHDEKVALTRTVLDVLERWGVGREDQCRLLGLHKQGAARRLRHYRLGHPLPEEGDVWTRVALLLRLATSIGQLFPHSAPSADLWVTTPRAKFGHKTPLQLMLADGVEGIARVQRSLDNLDLL
jgi:uncharacterized protein (DUF2384 family)